MKTYTETSIRNFDAWSGAKETQELILEHGKEKDFDFLIEELYPEGIDETDLNDILWHDSEWVLDSLNIRLDEEE
jgi:hypothetical protein